MVTTTGILRHSLSFSDQQKYSNKHSPAPLALGSSFMGPQAEGFVSHTSINHKAQDNMTVGGQFHSSNVLTYISYCRAVTWAHRTICSLPHSPLVATEKQPLWLYKQIWKHILLINQYYKEMMCSMLMYCCTAHTAIYIYCRENRLILIQSSHAQDGNSGAIPSILPNLFFLLSIPTWSNLCCSQSLSILILPLLSFLTHKLLFPLMVSTKLQLLLQETWPSLQNIGTTF